MSEQELREKIKRIVAPYVSAWGDDDALTNALIAAEIGDVSEYKCRMELAERALYNACLCSTNKMLSFLLQAEKELKGEKR